MKKVIVLVLLTLTGWSCAAESGEGLENLDSSVKRSSESICYDNYTPCIRNEGSLGVYCWADKYVYNDIWDVDVSDQSELVNPRYVCVSNKIHSINVLHEGARIPVKMNAHYVESDELASYCWVNASELSKKYTCIE